MKNKSETTWLAFTAVALSTLNSIPEPADNEPELTDEQIEAMGESEVEVPQSEYSRLAAQLLEDIHAEEPYFRQVERDNAKENWEEAQDKAEQGLTTEINRSVSLVNVSDTVENIADLLKRHPYGFKNGSRNAKGQVIEKPYTQAEDEAAEKLMACVKSGTAPVVSNDDDGE